ncbi:MAG: tetratricopeptide repeat protein [Bdellovibrionales bacterium]
MQLNQASAFQFVSVVKQGQNKYLRQALEKMSLAADSLGDDTLLNYALSKVKVDEFPKAHRDMLYYRIGEYQLANQQYSNAVSSLKRVNVASPYYPRSKYLQGLAFAEQGNNSQAIRQFEQLANVRADRGITDESRVAALLGRARIFYQGKKWEEAIDAYRDIPRDTEFWHDSIFEMSWAMLRMGRFRSALSNFHSLHSAYYEDTFQPESLLLRSIIYLYICKYDEMEKVLQLFSKVYGPVLQSIKNVQKTNLSMEQLFDQVIDAQDYIKGNKEVRAWSNMVPYIVAKRIYYEGDFQRMRNYIDKLMSEKSRLNKMPDDWRSSAIGKYSAKVLETRLSKAKSKAGRIAKAHINDIRAELFDLFEQKDFIRFEMLKGKKDALKKDLAGKDLSDVQIDEKSERDFYIQNGYQYWPFKGEYWLDELGNYHYLGVQSCE